MGLANVKNQPDSIVLVLPSNPGYYIRPMTYLLLLGLIAASCTTLAFLPQFIKVWKTRSAHDISLAMYIVVCTGVLLWLIYGILIKDTPLIVANAVTFVLAGSILVMKIRLK
jgi:MtN3 and saliva related transmembrane protein